METLLTQPRILWSVRYFYFWHCGVGKNQWYCSTWSHKDKLDWFLPPRWHWGLLRSSAFTFQSSHLYGWLVWWGVHFFARRHQSFEDEVVKKGFKMFTQTGLVPYYMTSRIKKNDNSAPCSYESLYLLALPHAYQCSNQYEKIYSESWHVKHVDNRIYIIEPRIESSSENDLHKLEVQ